MNLNNLKPIMLWGLVPFVMSNCKKEPNKDGSDFASVRSIECAPSVDEYASPLSSSWAQPHEVKGRLVLRVNVHDKLPMYQCGLRTGDIIEKLNGVPIDRVQPSDAIGRTWRMSVKREAERFELVLRLPLLGSSDARSQ